MKRWHEEINVANRNWRNHRRMHVESNKDHSRNRIGIDPYEVDCTCDDQVGRFRKRDAYDCGKPHCFSCHSEKYPKRSLTEQELRSDRDFEEQVKEL